MKLPLSIAAALFAFALASPAQTNRHTYIDSYTNSAYEGGWKSGVGAGEGFGPWTIETRGSGDGWAGCGIWPLSANGFQGTWSGKTHAFGLVGKGTGFSVTASRSFRKPLAVGDSFSLEMAVNWDGNRKNSIKGFALTVQGEPIVTVNHEFDTDWTKSGWISINCENTSSDILNTYGILPMTWTFTAKDATTLSVTATARDDSSKVYSADWEGLSTSAIDGFRLQSSNQVTENDDRRQTYFDNFVLDIAGDVPSVGTLTLDEDNRIWAITNAGETALAFTITRTSGEGPATVAVEVLSDTPGFVTLSTDSVTFPDGETNASFTGTATLSGNAQVAKVCVSGEGFDSPPSWDVKGPAYSCGRPDGGIAEPGMIWAGDTPVFAVTNIQASWFLGNDDLVTVVSADTNVLRVAERGNWEANGNETRAIWTLEAVAPGETSVEVYYDGVWMTEAECTVAPPVFALSGPAFVWSGTTNKYLLGGHYRPNDLPATVSVVGDATASPEIGEGSAIPASISLEFGNTTGTVTLSVDNGRGCVSSLDILVSEPVDYSAYVAYDEAALYSDFNKMAQESTGKGSAGFSHWIVGLDASAQYGGIVLSPHYDRFPAIFSNGTAFGLYANGEQGTNGFSVLRPFASYADLAPGQKASVDFVLSPDGGVRYVQFVGIDGNGSITKLFDIWNYANYIGVNIEGVEPWSGGLAAALPVVASVERAANGSSYKLRLESLAPGADGREPVFECTVESDLDGWRDGIQGILIGATDSESDFLFNRLAIQQVEESAVERKIGWGDGVWSPEGDGIYTITLTATTDDIGEVAIAVEPADGALSLSSDTVDFAGGKTVTIAYTLAGVKEGDSFRISATPADSGVAALDGEDALDVTVSGPYLSLRCDAGSKFTTDTTDIFLSLSASPSKYGTYSLVSTDPSVIALSREAITIPNDDGDSTVGFWVFVRGGGKATVYLAEDESVKWGFEISDVKPVDLKDVVTFEQGALKFKLPESATIMSTTNLVTGPWVAYPAEVGEDGEVVILTTGPGSFYRIGEPPPSHPIVGTTVWEGSENMGNNWSKSVTVASDKFAGITAGTIIQIYADHNSDATYWQIKPLDGSWREISSHKDLVNEWGTIDLGSATETQFALNEADAKSISETGFIVMGYGITVKKVSIIQAAANAKKRTRDLSQPPGFCLP